MPKPNQKSSRVQPAQDPSALQTEGPPTPALVVGGLTPLTTIDFPGELAAVVFCQGCPWRCRYCQNGHLLPRERAPAPGWQEVRDFLGRRRGLLDAVVFSGGEPTLQAGLLQAMRQVRALGFKVGLHSAGCYPRRLAALLPEIDWLGLDIKALPEDYPALTGAPGSGERAWQSLEAVLSAGVDCEVRVTVHRQLLPDEKLRRLIGRLGDAGAPRVVLQRCRSGQALDPGLPRGGAAWPGGERRRVI
jgi:pyruvate formate lyase activating enzyme